jgi:phosphate transport system permease protein
LSATGALVLAGGLGILSAVWLHFYAPSWLARSFRGLIDLMAGVPSVVYGLWGLEVLVPLIARISPPGPSLLAGIVILTMMIVPTVVLLADAALMAVPRDSLAAAAALGLSRETTAFRVAVPAARSGLGTALLLGLARALGETMAVVMVCGNVVRLPASVFDPVRTLTATIALEMGYARGDHRSALFVCGLVLLGTVAGIIALAEFISRRRRHVPA